jgi:hypothetical protein
MFREKISHVKLKKDKATINMVLVVTTRSQNPRLVLPREKEPRKTKIAED